MIPGAGVHLWKQRRAYCCRHIHDPVATPSYHTTTTSSSSSQWIIHDQQSSVAAAAAGRVVATTPMDQTAREARQRLDHKLRHIRQPSRLNNMRKENEMMKGGRKTLARDPNDEWKQLLGGILRDIMSLM